MFELPEHDDAAHALVLPSSTKQRAKGRQLEIQKADVENRSKETITQLENEIDNSISESEMKLAEQIRHEQELSERLAMESDILQRKFASTEETIEDVREHAALLSLRGDEYESLLKTREAERERLDTIDNTKQMELTTKKGDVSRLMSTHRQLQKSGDIEKDRLQDVTCRAQRGPEANEATCQELLRTTSNIKQQQQTNLSTQETIAKRCNCISVEQKDVICLENKVCCPTLHTLLSTKSKHES